MKCLTTLLFFIVPAILFSQRMQLNIGAGIINYGGDLQDKNFTFQQSNAAFSLGLSYIISEHFSVTAAYTTGKVSASDTRTKNYTRNLSFQSNINEGSLVLEAQLKEINDLNKFTPYIFGGVAVFHFNPYTFDTAGTKFYLQPLKTEGQGLAEYPDRKQYALTQFAIPFGVGAKYAISQGIMLSTEIGFRKLFTDHLDDLGSKTYADTAILRSAYGDVSADLSFRGDEVNPPQVFSTKLTRGNPNRKDSYYTCLIKISFALGNSSASLRSNSSKKMRKQSSCPPKVL